MTGPIQPLRAFVDAELAAALEDEITSPEQIDAEMAAGKPPAQSFERNAIALLVSDDMALMMGLREPTPEEADQMVARAAEWRAQVAQAWRLYDAARAALDALEGEVTRAVLDLHAPHEGTGHLTCHGCDVEGSEWEHPEWPCRTVQAVAKPHGITLPDGYRLALRYDRETGAYVRVGEGQ